MDVATLLRWISDEIIKAKANVDYNQVMASYWFWLDLLAKVVPAIVGAVGVYVSAKKKLADLSFKVSIVSIFLTAVLLAFPAGNIATQYDEGAKAWSDIALSLEIFEHRTENSDLADDDPIDTAMFEWREESIRRVHEVERPETATWKSIWGACYARQIERIWGPGVDTFERAQLAKAGKEIPKHTFGEWLISWRSMILTPIMPAVVAFIGAAAIGCIAFRNLNRSSLSQTSPIPAVAVPNKA